MKNILKYPNTSIRGNVKGVAARGANTCIIMALKRKFMMLWILEK